MKTKKILGLGICALSLGMVAGVVGTQHALEAQAGEADITVYFRDATWWAADGARSSAYLWKDEVNNVWPGEVMSLVGESEGHGVWKATIDATKYEKLIFARYAANDSDDNKDWGAKTVEINLSDFDPDKPLYDISGQATAVWGDPGVTGSWIAYEEPEPVEYTLGLVGIGGEWGKPAAGTTRVTTDAVNTASWADVELEVGTAFKIARINGEATDWSKPNYGYDALDAASKLVVGDKDASGNIVIKTSGVYDIAFQNGTVTISLDHEIEHTYTATLNGVAVPLEETAAGEYMSAQYQGSITGTKGQQFKVFVDDVLVTSDINSDEGSSVAYSGAGGIFTLRDDVENAPIYIKIWNSGWITVWADQHVVYTGYYLIDANTSWGPIGAKVSDGSNEQNDAYFINVNMAVDYQFVIGYFKDGVRDTDVHEGLDYGWSHVDTVNSDALANFEAGTDNHIKVKTAHEGGFSIYLNKTSGLLSLNLGGIDPTEKKAADDLAVYIDEKGAESYAGMTDQQRIDSCTTKYNKALTDYNALGEAAQKYFRETYEDQYAVLQYWQSRVAPGSTSFRVDGLSNSNPTLIITISVIAGAAVAGAGIYLISKKRKHN